VADLARRAEPGGSTDSAELQRSLFRRWPSGVSVVVAELDGRRAGLTVSSLVSLSLEPSLVGVSIARVASLYEVLQEAGEWAVSVLAGEQAHLAQHFARSVPPIALWNGIPVREDDPRLIADAVGWITARTIEEVAAGDHTFFIGAVQTLELGSAASSLVHVDRTYSAL
jgi:flavin reductase